jgi:GTP cyclohydrolase IA
MSLEKTIELCRDILTTNRIDLNDPNFKDTPKRAGKFLHQFLNGYTEEEVKELFKSSFPSELKDMVVIENIKVYGLCPHHLAPVEMKVWIGYIPSGKVLGLSKFCRLAKLIAKKPMLQEDYVRELAHVLMQNLQPDGVIVLSKGKHSCMRMRGVEQHNSKTSMAAVRGAFKLHDTRTEFYQIIGLPEES